MMFPKSGVGCTLAPIKIHLAMQENHQPDGRLGFGVFEVDLRAGELRKHGLRIRLQEQPFQVLAMLLEHVGQVVTREELQRKLWPADTFVDFDHGLNKAVNKIRDALGDSAESPRFVETVARRGYRFLAEVKAADEAALRSPEFAPPQLPRSQTGGRAELADTAAMPQPRLPPLAWKISAFVLLAVIAAFAAWKVHSRNRPASAIHSLAVLPLESLSNDASQDYFADGMTDELISDLGQISALRVISRTSVMAYKHARKPLPQIARELNVDAIVEGTVLRSGDQVRITAQLIDATADKHLWSQSYEGELKATLALPNKVARAIAAALMLIALLFQLGVQQRAAELGTLAAIGVGRPTIARLLSREALVVAVVDLAHELVGELVDRGLHVARGLARAQRVALEVDGRLGDLRLGDAGVVLDRQLDLDLRQLVDATVELLELPLYVAPHGVAHLEVLALDVKLHRRLPCRCVCCG